MELLLGRAGTRATRQPCQLLAGQIAPLRLAHIGLAVAFHALQHVRAVAAFERLDLPVMHLPHRLAHLVEEPAVVRDDQQRAGPLRPTVLQVFGEPVDRHDVQVVCRLVECEHIPVLEQQAGEVGAATLAAGERADPRIEIEAAEQRLDDLAGLRLRGPFVILAAFERGLADRGVIVELVTLVEHAERQAVARGDTARIRSLRAFEQVQQRGFAVAVAADDAYAVAFEHALRDVGENGLRGEVERDMFESQIKSWHGNLSLFVTSRKSL